MRTVSNICDWVMHADLCVPWGTDDFDGLVILRVINEQRHEKICSLHCNCAADKHLWFCYIDRLYF